MSGARGNGRWAASLRATNALASALLMDELGVSVNISADTAPGTDGTDHPPPVEWASLAGGAGLHAHLEVWPHDHQHAAGWASNVVERMAIDDAGPTGPHAPVVSPTTAELHSVDGLPPIVGAFHWGRITAPGPHALLPPGFLGGPSKALWVGLGRYSPRAACFLKRFWLRTCDQQRIVDNASREGGYCAAACSFVADNPTRWASFSEGCASVTALPAGTGGQRL